MSAILLVGVVTTSLASVASGGASHSRAALVSGACVTRLASIGGTEASSELITVVAPSNWSQHATLDLYRRTAQCWRRVLGPYAAFVGENGLSTHHHEGDGTTPIGLFSIATTMYGTLSDPGVAYPYHRLTCGDWWDENVRSALYNHFVHVRCGVTPDFARGSEALWTEVPAYNYFAVIDYNSSPVVSGRGSGIFLHVARGAATTGCVSIPQRQLVDVLVTLRRSLSPLILITTTSGLAQLEEPHTTTSSTTTTTSTTSTIR